MALIDISVPIQAGMVVCEGDPPVQVQSHLAMARGDYADVSRLVLGSHTGTHVDAPAHFIPGGATVDQLPLGALVGPAAVVEVAAAGIITRGDLEGLGSPPAARLLLKTRNSSRGSPGHFATADVALDDSAAEWAVEQGLRLIGIDGLSIEGWQAPGYPVHRRLLGAGVVILEGLDLSGVRPGTYELLCLPLRLEGLDGAPCRALLRA